MTIELDYGGAGLPINGLAPINATDDLYVGPDKTVWLKTGSVADDTAGDYPDATVSTNAIYTGTSFDVSSQDVNPFGIVWDGTHLWVVGCTSKKV